MVTQFHTLLHFLLLFPPVLILSASVAASTRNPEVSKSHLLSHFTHIHTLMRITQAIAAGPIHYARTTAGIPLVSIHMFGNHARTMRVLRVMITTRLFLNTVNRSPRPSQSLRMVYTVFTL